jgi:hypothetical protein
VLRAELAVRSDRVAACASDIGVRTVKFNAQRLNRCSAAHRWQGRLRLGLLKAQLIKRQLHCFALLHKRVAVICTQCHGRYRTTTTTRTTILLRTDQRSKRLALFGDLAL